MQHDTATGSLVAGRYCADELGAPFKVYLEDGFAITRRLGDEIISIVDLPGLIAAVVQTRALHPRKLSGADLRFIRTALRMKSKDVAEAVGLTPEHYSRCEAGKKPMASGTEKTYRAFVFIRSVLRDQAVQEALKAPRVSARKAQKAFGDLAKVFMEMKIEVVSDAKEELAFSFTRESANRNKPPCGNDNEPEWEKVEPKAA